MPTITYMSIEQAKEEIRQREVTERIRRFATSDPEVAKDTGFIDHSRSVMWLYNLYE